MGLDPLVIYPSRNYLLTGKRRRESFAQAKMARARIEEITYRKIKGEPVDSQEVRKMTLGEIIDDYRAKCLQTESEASFNRNRRFALERFEKHFGRPMVDFERDCIALPEGMTKNKQALDVPISYSLRHVLKAIRKAQLEQHLAAGRTSKPPKHVFTYSKKLNGRIVASPVKDIKTAFQAARRRSKLDNVRFHDSRHTCATHLRDAGVDMHMIGTILGHSWTNMTQRYAHENWEPKKEAISHIEQLIAESAGTYWRTPQNEGHELTEHRTVNAL